ncbi:uncharacterized protein LOC113855970 [Abrus precatorius]|uniref:Uncharacterized protein LOC113855970 n=1 Tax=Abrus precatorius TaxID=3816 RepID=A0A8B8KHW5_ABRPR|nr:uncharacterized protein LOC113855970 [Abrus precatorius]
MDDSELSELFDKVLLGTGLGKGTPPNMTFQEGGGNDKQVVDLRTLLMLCAQASASDNLSYANKLLKQIRQHSSIIGDGTQRLAHYFGNALEARLAGTGLHVYSVLSNKIISAKDLIKAYQMYASVCPFEKLAIMFANQSIWNLAKEAETLHIIDFGIGYGFKWPALINRISKRAGGPPKLRITGIELPQPGFRPEEKVKETGHRLAGYCKRFNVPFEYNAIARRWETIKVEDLKIEKNEFVAVNCMFRFKNLFDETVVVNNPRDAVLSLIKKANPDIFVHGIVNGCYDAPFFVTRFREALFHYSAFFDILDINVARENPMRFMFEKELFGREVMNIIACEGSERVERPETYKQWQLRNMRSGFKQLPLDHQIIDILRDRLRGDGHNTNFMSDVDGNWMLQGWKGRILHASSCWIPLFQYHYMSSNSTDIVESPEQCQNEVEHSQHMYTVNNTTKNNVFFFLCTCCVSKSLLLRPFCDPAMDSNFVGSSYNFDDEGNLVLVSDSNDWDFHVSDPTFYPSDAGPLGFPPNTGFNSEPLVASSDVAMATVADPSLEDADFSETFKFISQVLMEESFEQRPCMCYDPLSLQHTEKSFYDALEPKLPLSPNQHPLESPDGNGSNSTTDSGSSANSHELKPHSPDSPVSGGDYAFHSLSHTPSLQVPQHGLTNISDGLLDLDSSATKLLAENIFSDADSMLQFRRGLEEASKFLPQRPQLFTGLESTKTKVSAEAAEKRERSYGLKGRKNHERQDSNDEEEGRSNKQYAVCVEEESEISEIFDRVLLSVENVPLCAEKKDGPVVDSNINAQLSEQPHLFEGGKIRSKKQGRKKEVDLRTLLVLCAQAVSASDNRTANELLKQIGEHSSRSGDASQRLAHYFAEALKTRLVGAAGTGTQIFYMSHKNFTATHFLKKFAHFFANKMIMKMAEKAETLHIIDFGILYGFQWPILIKFLSNRSGGPPKLRVTGIEYPQAGFRPAERIEETGRRLDKYCKRFNVPFEYKAIASRNWETIQIEELKIERNEVLAVNCLVRFKNLLDETIEVNSPRNAVLNLIRKMKPDIFVHSLVNGSYNAPFFVTRFREALFHYSAIYDMFDTLISRDNQWRLMLESEFLGREIMNVVACESFERVERPETYKQWQVRNTRAGFRQLPLDKELMAKFRNKLREWYHRDFVFDEDNHWMLQGWKGRILYASTCWVPAYYCGKGIGSDSLLNVAFLRPMIDIFHYVVLSAGRHNLFSWGHAPVYSFPLFETFIKNPSTLRFGASQIGNHTRAHSGYPCPTIVGFPAAAAPSPKSNFLIDFKMLSTNSLVQNFHGPISVFPNQNQAMNGFELDDSSSPSSGTSSSGESTEVTKYSNPILRYISDILMDEEDDLERKPCMLQECLRLQAEEKSFYDVLGHSYPSSLHQITSCFHDESIGITDPDENFGPTASFESNGSCTTDNSYESDLVNSVGEFDSSFLQLQTPLVDSPERTYHVVPDPFSEFKKAGFFHNGTWNIRQSQTKPLVVVEGSSSSASREKRSYRMDDTSDEQEGRGSKVSAVFSDNSEPLEILDEVLLCQTGRSQTPLCAIEASQTVDSVGGSNGKSTRSRSKKGSTNTGGTAVDLWTLLTQCAQAVASYDQRNANDLLKQIRQHSSRFGDGLQRLAHYFAIGLETRLAAGTPSYMPLEVATAADMLKAYKLFVTSSPLQRMSNLLTTKTIISLVKNESSVHIIDFGICYGFQWPCLIKKLSERPGGPPRLHITGIDLPQPGFRPAERVEETGRRLENYCKKFKVPFKYNCIAQKWETIRLEDIKIDRNEITVVNCLYRLRNLPDETVTVNCPRDAVLKLIRKINPNIFIHGVVNGTYSAPFFLTRFREALYHFSSLFDMFDANVQREDPQREMLEKGLFGRDAINVIACEGAERVERPETYKQWQVRNLRAGFKQVRLDPELVNEAKTMVKREYHKDFVVAEDGKWVLQGWKGRILNAFSAWVPA